MSLHQLISQQGFDQFRPGAEAHFRAHGLKYSITYEKGPDPSLHIRLEGSKKQAEIHVFESGESRISKNDTDNPDDEQKAQRVKLPSDYEFSEFNLHLNQIYCYVIEPPLEAPTHPHDNIKASLLLLTMPEVHCSPTQKTWDWDFELEAVAKRFLKKIGIDDAQYHHASDGKSSISYWWGRKENLEYQVIHAHGPHRKDYPYWVLINPPFAAVPDVSSRKTVVHALAQKLNAEGWPCLIKGYISATSNDLLI